MVRKSQYCHQYHQSSNITSYQWSSTGILVHLIIHKFHSVTHNHHWIYNFIYNYWLYLLSTTGSYWNHYVALSCLKTVIHRSLKQKLEGIFTVRCFIVPLREIINKYTRSSLHWSSSTIGWASIVVTSEYYYQH